MEQLDQPAQHHQRVLEVRGVEVVQQDAQCPVGKLGGNRAAPDLDHQVLVPELLDGALGDEGLAGPVVTDKHDAAAGTRRQGLDDFGNYLLPGEGSVLVPAVAVSLRRKGSFCLAAACRQAGFLLEHMRDLRNHVGAVI